MSKEVLARIQARLDKLGLKEAPAAVAAGLSDSAIRNVRRKIEADPNADVKFSMRTLESLAPILGTTVSWLLEEVGDEELPTEVREMNEIFPGLQAEDQRSLLALARSLRRAGQKGGDTAPGEGGGPPAGDG